VHISHIRIVQLNKLEGNTKEKNMLTIDYEKPNYIPIKETNQEEEKASK
jgi:hypothetical protein